MGVSMSEWYVAVGGQRQGPLSTDSVLAYLKSRDRAEVHVWRKGFENWRLAKDVPELNAPTPAPMQGAVSTKANVSPASLPNTRTVGTIKWCLSTMASNIILQRTFQSE
jgi:GYF domain 2